MKDTAYARDWNNLQAHTEFYWQLLQTIPEDKLKKQPEAGKWSALQVMEHLAGAEESALQYLLKKNYTPLSTKSRLPASLRSFMLKWALRSPLKFKAPKVEALVPYNTTPPGQLLQRWQGIRAGYNNYLKAAPPDAKTMPLFRHPFAGPLTLPQMLQFMAEHLDHHRRQVKLIFSEKE